LQTWPDFSDELSRKALDTFERAVHRRLVVGDMTADELRIVVDTLTDTISGLVPKDVTDTIYGARKELGL
jgi:hypothetical protein